MPEYSKKKKNATNTDELQALLQALPQILGEFRTYFEILFGKKMTSPIYNKDLTTLERKLKKFYPISQQLEIAQKEILTPESARKRLSLMNDYLRLFIHRIPKNQEPIDSMIDLMSGYIDTPSNQGLSESVDYVEKYNRLRVFINKLLEAVPRSDIDLFLNSGFSEQQFVSPFQRAFNNLSLPKVLREPPIKATIYTVEKIKSALHELLNDWEVFVDLIYGLVQLKESQVPSWDSIRKNALWNKVGTIILEPELVILVKHEWVTIRNAIAHGRAAFIPSESSIKFSDKNRIVCWTIKQVNLEAINIYLANRAMMMVWNILQEASLKTFKEHLAFLRGLATQ